MDVNRMTVEEFRAFPLWRDVREAAPITSIVILPTEELHDSGFRAMDFVACAGREPVGRLSGCSDVLHLDGIGGFGKDWLKLHGGVPNTAPLTGWSIDCLPVSGLLRLFPSFDHCTGIDFDSMPLSSFEIFGIPKSRPAEKAS